MHEPLEKLEKNLDKLLGDESPYQLPKDTKKSISDTAWWVFLIVGLLQLWAAWTLWQLGHSFSAAQNIQNYFNNGVAYQYNALPKADFTYYLAFFCILVESAFILLAIPALKDYRKQGWNLLYYALLLNVVYAFIRIFSTIGGGLGQFIVQFFISAVIAYFLFQIRPFFHKKS